LPENLYRKWRPRTFAEVAGQEHVTTTLVNALASGRVAHAYLLAGPRGTGKTSTGRLLAKALNCPQRENGEPCNHCDSCLSYLAGRALDLIELDAASNRGIDEIRSLRDKVAFAAGGDFKVYLIDEVHMLTDAAFNALLKTLEEPPPHVVFVLATTDAHKVPATILSRCQRFDFRRVSMSAAAGCLRMICAAEGFTVPEAALEMIARSSTGSMRDAENLLEQLVTSYGLELTVEHVRTGLGLLDEPRAAELARLAVTGDLGAGLATIASVRDDGLDLRQFQREVVDSLRSFLLVKSGLSPSGGVTSEQEAEMAATVKGIAVPVLLGALRAFGEADLKPDPNSTIPLDLALAECVLGRESGIETASAPPPTASPPSRARPAVPETPGEVSRSPAPKEKKASVPTGVHADEVSPGVEAKDELPAFPAGSIAMSADAVRDMLPKIYEEVRKRQVNVGALLNSECDIIEATEDEVTFGFRFENLAKKTAETQNLKLISEVISEAMKRPIRVRCVADASVTSWRRREQSASPLVRAAQEMGARLLSRDEE
jgi:DNA polymerase-3 subunit gamma/tau